MNNRYVAMTSSPSCDVVVVSNGEKAIPARETVKQPTSTFVLEEPDRMLWHGQLA
jgi:hypothetical protein